MKIWHDYQPDEIITRLNTLLKEHGLWFEDDGKEHDGYMEYELKQNAEPTRGPSVTCDHCCFDCCDCL